MHTLWSDQSSMVWYGTWSPLCSWMG